MKKDKACNEAIKTRSTSGSVMSNEMSNEQAMGQPFDPLISEYDYKPP